MPASPQRTIFEKYRRGPAAGVAKRFGGWGLGLVFCRLAAERHGDDPRRLAVFPV